ncbi:hypothetical protein RSOLAG22IIIB_13352 [Rhizoctonia solani]|uniref:Manganese lipoxygenase n=1 Tax=Rhizoctonia solani TaxID=456999 RepID=A0A0K6FML6_9AGAM|nr:hypothetical protein RSOLAG22IIIB_13352 [Rhizoctonia solani]
MANPGNLYQWATDSAFPPHAATVPPPVNKIDLQIFNLVAFLQTGGMLVDPPRPISAQYLRLAPNANTTSLDQVVANNQLQRGPPGVSSNMLFPFNIGDRDDWYSDAVFAQQHFTGTNPTTITLIGDDLKAEFEEAVLKIDEEEHKKNVQDHLKTCEGSLYVQDYRYFREAMGLSGDQDIASGTGRYGVAPVALFHLRDDGKLHPLAIVIDYKGTMANSVVIFNSRLEPTSKDQLHLEKQDWPWRYAKTCVQCADWLRHEVTIHLVNTHLVEEVVIVAANRTLPTSHIVYQLLEKHWETTLSLNDQARKVLVPKVIAEIAGAQWNQLVSFIGHAYKTFDWTKLYIPKDLSVRGFPSTTADLDNPKFHNYAYARNMVPMWQAIRAFVAEVLNAHYADNAAVKNDQALQKFCDEMLVPQSGNMPSFLNIADSDSPLDDLIDTVTMCIHIASPQHTAVNYLQQYYQVFVPNKPWALYQPLPTTLAELREYREQHLIDALPFKCTKDWLIGAQLAYLLSFEVIGQNSLLSYATHQSSDPKADPAIRTAAQHFEQQLQTLQGVFTEHSNALDDQGTPYTVMDPAVTAVSILI